MDNQKEKLLEKFRKDVAWLEQNVAPDDIYDFAEQALMAADFFIKRWSEFVDLQDVIENDYLAGSWLKNIVGLRILRDNGHEVNIDTNFDPKII